MIRAEMEHLCQKLSDSKKRLFALGPWFQSEIWMDSWSFHCVMTA